MNKLKKIISNSPYLLLMFGFLLVILIGAILLSMPFASANGERTSFLNALFTATSATCVTGLIVVDTGTHFNQLGHVILLILIQIGGIGIMAFIAVSINIFKGKLSIKNKLNIQEAYNITTIGDGWKIIKSIFIISLTIEAIGTILLSLVYIPIHGFTKGLFYALFHSVSAFNNAGFDLNGNFTSLTNYASNPIIMYTTMVLISLGSLGFICILDILNKKSFKKLTLNSKLVISFTCMILVFTSFLFLIIEFNNPDTLKTMALQDKISSSMFLSITPRTAGFNSINMNGLKTASCIIFIMLMYIGASPSSTGGGIKTTTIMVAILSILALFKGKEDIEIFERRIPKNLILKSCALISIVFLISLFAIIILSLTENADFLTILFEVASALNTVGVSLGLTQHLTSVGKLLIITLMFIGRVGPLTTIMALSLKQKNESNIKYIEEKILIG